MTKLKSVNTQIPGNHIEEAFTEKTRFKSSRTAVASGGGFICYDRQNVEVDIWNSVGSRKELTRSRGKNSPRGANVGTHVSDDLGTQCEYQSVARTCDLDIAINFARMIGRHHVFASIFLPFYRTTKMPRRKRYKEVLGVKFAANSKGSSHVEFDQINFLVRKPEHSREHLSIEERHFR